MKNLCVIIPCFNEENRIKKNLFLKFLNDYPNNRIVFVNDGSNDNTFTILSYFKVKKRDQVIILNNKKNLGKAESVRKGMLFAKENFKNTHIGYLDADLSSSFDEITRLAKHLSKKTLFVFGSRILKLDNKISRKKHRFVIGRFIATIISNMLKFSVYDTQCGCKVFDYKLVAVIFEKQFISKWLFDVEIFFRLRREYGKQKLKELVKEIPLKVWIDTPDSRVSFLYFFKIWSDLFKINQKYN
tara:strand:- start:37701 stop:38429 length:729 start_codon:yes stop_codon:yes gene_type:complete